MQKRAKPLQVCQVVPPSPSPAPVKKSKSSLPRIIFFLLFLSLAGAGIYFLGPQALVHFQKCTRKWEQEIHVKKIWERSAFRDSLNQQKKQLLETMEGLEDQESITRNIINDLENKATYLQCLLDAATAQSQNLFPEIAALMQPLIDNKTLEYSKKKADWQFYSERYSSIMEEFGQQRNELTGVSNQITQVESQICQTYDQLDPDFKSRVESIQNVCITEPQQEKIQHIEELGVKIQEIEELGAQKQEIEELGLRKHEIEELGAKKQEIEEPVADVELETPESGVEVTTGSHQVE